MNSSGDAEPVPPAPLRLWVEIALIAVFYAVYSWVRNQFGSGRGPDAVEAAAANAEWVIDVQSAVGLLIEDEVQQAFIDWTAFIQFWNLFYGLFHFLFTGLVLVFLFRWRPDDYRFWRRAGLSATGLALIGFAAFPLMPPRLMGNCGEWGACQGYAFVDTVIDVGGIWSFESGGMAAVSNQYAAMPSLHIGWALWCSLAVLATVEHRAVRLGAWLYPACTLFAIVVTANHWWLDAVGGVIVVLAGLGVARALGHWSTRHKNDLGPEPASGSPAHVGRPPTS